MLEFSNSKVLIPGMKIFTPPGGVTTTVGSTMCPTLASTLVRGGRTPPVGVNNLSFLETYMSCLVLIPSN